MSDIPPLFYIFALQIEVILANGDIQFRYHKRFGAVFAASYLFISLNIFKTQT